jgi:hypothetical protein
VLAYSASYGVAVSCAGSLMVHGRFISIRKCGDHTLEIKFESLSVIFVPSHAVSVLIKTWVELITRVFLWLQ